MYQFANNTTYRHSGVKNVISDDFFNLIQKKPAKGGRKLKSSGLSDFCRICTCSFAIHLGNLGKTPNISAENLFQRCYTVWYSSTTKLVQHNCLAEKFVLCFGILHPKSLPSSSENKLVFHFSNHHKHIVLC